MLRRLNVLSPWVLVAAIAVGCVDSPVAPIPPEAEPTHVLLIMTDSMTYRPSTAVEVRLLNKSESVIQMNLCPWQLDHWTGTVWQIAAVPLALCTAELHALAPRDSARTTIHLLGDFPKGSYRFRFEQLLDDEGVLLPVTERVTNVFRFD